jgi:uncharacterized protein DUF5992
MHPMRDDESRYNLNKVSIMKKLFFVLLLAFPILSNAALQLVKGATITSIANTNGDQESFTIWISGGTGPCVDSTLTFPKTAVSSLEIYQRAYATALAAFAAGFTVTAHDYQSELCHNAGYIKITK